MKTKHASRSKHPAATATRGNIPPVAPMVSTNPAPPESHRPLDLQCYLGDGQEQHYAALTSIRAGLNPNDGYIVISATSDDHRFAKLSLDHTQTRAVLLGLTRSLAELARLRGGNPRTACLKNLRQFNVSHLKSADQSPADVQVKALPWREMVYVSAHSAVGGYFTMIGLCLTELEAEALTYDLERALRNMERFTDLGI